MKAAAEALKAPGVVVEHVGIPALEKDFALDVFKPAPRHGMKPAFAAATAGRQPDEIYKMAKTMLSLPDTPMSAYIDAEQPPNDCVTASRNTFHATMRLSRMYSPSRA